jgi:hypothetical protein
VAKKAKVKKAKAKKAKARKTKKAAVLKKTKKAKKAAARVPKKAVTAASREMAQLTAGMHTSAFRDLVSLVHEHGSSPVCYRVFPDNSAQICRLLSDGSYGDCQPYNLRPVPDPRCG